MPYPHIATRYASNLSSAQYFHVGILLSEYDLDFVLSS